MYKIVSFWHTQRKPSIKKLLIKRWHHLARRFCSLMKSHQCHFQTTIFHYGSPTRVTRLKICSKHVNPTSMKQSVSSHNFFESIKLLLTYVRDIRDIFNSNEFDDEASLNGFFLQLTTAGQNLCCLSTYNLPVKYFVNNNIMGMPVEVEFSWLEILVCKMSPQDNKAYQTYISLSPRSKWFVEKSVIV